MTNQEIKKIDLKILEDTIIELKENKEACILSGGNENADILGISESIPSKKILDFFEYLYKENCIDLLYSINMEKIPSDENIHQMTYEECITRLTFLHRNDRMCSGSLYSDVQSGLLLKLLQRIKDLLNQDASKKARDVEDLINKINQKLKEIDEEEKLELSFDKYRI